MNISKLLIRINIQENFLALNKMRFKLIIILFFLMAANVFSEDWYVSNSAGMMIEKTVSHIALRESYALKIETQEPNKIPILISEYIDSALSVLEVFNAELHTLYENGTEKNQRWILRYTNGKPWIVLSVPKTGNNGFAEYYDESGLLIQEDTFLGESILSVRYTYQDKTLLQSETQNGEIRLWSDEYRYARSGSLRSIVRTFYSDETDDAVKLSNFAPLGPEYENYSAPKSFVPAISSDFISDILYAPNIVVESVTDDKGRIISEIHKDEEGNIIGELTNTWSVSGGDRLASIAWNGENDTRLIEYEYDEMGNRLIERNYRDGILERLVRTEEDGEVEELYLHGVLSLRAVWKDGQKISEEYFHQNPRGNR